MKPTPAQNLLSACCGARRVTIGLETPEELRRLSDARLLTCPGCRAPVVLHAGTARAHHFAHLPGAVCSLPHTEPETEEHRAGKLLLARWLRERLPDAAVTVEAYLPATGQRADVLLEQKAADGTGRRVALEFQCASLAAREWRRRHRLYRHAGIEDLWFLGGSRFHREETAGARPLLPANASAAPPAVILRSTELERALLQENAPLLFLDAAGERFDVGTLVRFRPAPDAQALRPVGNLSSRPLLALDFPWPLLDWPQAARPAEPIALRPTVPPSPASSLAGGDARLWIWLEQRYRITPDTLSPFFGLPLPGQEVFACELRLWQAAIYYRFVHQGVGEGWWLPQVETWVRAYLPLVPPVSLKKLQAALHGFQEMLAAAGMLSLPRGHKRVSARIIGDLTTLQTLPDREETLRLLRYRRTLLREGHAAYLAGK